MAFELIIEKSGIANLIFDLEQEKVNLLRMKILKELEEKLDEIKENREIKLLIIKSAKENNFIAGADINEIKNLSNKEEALIIVKHGQEILSKLASLSCVTLAYIDGSCLGGGTELALACDYRIATDRSFLSLPEVNLGIIPGFGGTQRLPRLIGLTRSLPLILTGKAIEAKKALKIGLIDACFPLGYAENKLAEFTENLLKSSYQDSLRRQRAKKPIYERIKPLHKFIFDKAWKEVLQKTKGQYPAALSALAVIKKSYYLPLEKGLEIEVETFSELVVGDIAKNLISLYLTGEQIKKDKGREGETKEVKNVAILGAGIMGGGIAWLYSNLNFAIRIKDLNWQNIGLGFKQIKENYQELLKKKKIQPHEVTNKMALVSASIDYSGFSKIDLVAEAIIEDLVIKKQSFIELENHVSSDTIIASNTSALSVTAMAKSLKNPERFLGVHFFNPVMKMPLVEIIPHAETSNSSIATMVALMKRAKKTPIIVKDSPGFLVNRILLCYINEAFHLLDETGAVRKIDKIIEDFGMPMGPFILADAVGLDVGYKVAKYLEDNYGERMKVSPLIENLYNKAHLLGKKSGKGIYLYEARNKPVNHEIEPYISHMSEEISEESVLDRLILIMVNEAARCLAEGIVKNAAYLDMAMVTGTGFPAFRGGLLRYADQIGIKMIIAKLQLLSEIHGDRFKPCDFIFELAERNTSFY